MKATTIALALAGALTASATLEPCAQVCQDNMNSLASSFGCDSGDYACLCKVPEWGYGIHDCAWGSCLNDKAKAQPAVDWAKEECSKVNVPVTIPDADVPIVEGGSGVGFLTTATFSTTITTNGATTVVGVTTTISGTVTSGAGGASGASTTTSAFTTVVTSDGTAVTSTGASTITSGASTGTGTDASTMETSVTSGASSDAGPSPSGSGTAGAGTSTSSGFAAQMTAAPFAGFLAAAGIAAALL